MATIIVSEDCGNSPKNTFIQQLTIAFAEGDTERILNSVTDDIQWNIVGRRMIQGKDTIAEALEQMKHDNLVQVRVHHVVTHGKAGAVNGTLQLNNGHTHEFCTVYEFSGAKGTVVKAITSYVIDIS